MKKDASIQTRLDSKLREKFDALAATAKRKPADFLRLMIEDAVEKAQPKRKRELAGAK
jgi:predicted DNA-binding protein